MAIEHKHLINHLMNYTRDPITKHLEIESVLKALIVKDIFNMSR